MSSTKKSLVNWSEWHVRFEDFVTFSDYIPLLGSYIRISVNGTRCNPKIILPKSLPLMI